MPNGQYRHGQPSNQGHGRQPQQHQQQQQQQQQRQLHLPSNDANLIVDAEVYARNRALIEEARRTLELVEAQNEVALRNGQMIAEKKAKLQRLTMMGEQASRELQEIEEHERSFILPNTSNAQRQLLVGNLAVQSASTHPQQQADVPSNAQAHPVQYAPFGGSRTSLSQQPLPYPATSSSYSARAVNAQASASVNGDPGFAQSLNYGGYGGGHQPAMPAQFVQNAQSGSVNAPGFTSTEQYAPVATGASAVAYVPNQQLSASSVQQTHALSSSSRGPSWQRVVQGSSNMHPARANSSSNYAPNSHAASTTTNNLTPITQIAVGTSYSSSSLDGALRPTPSASTTQHPSSSAATSAVDDLQDNGTALSSENPASVESSLAVDSHQPPDKVNQPYFQDSDLDVIAQTLSADIDSLATQIQSGAPEEITASIVELPANHDLLHISPAISSRSVTTDTRSNGNGGVDARTASITAVPASNDVAPRRVSPIVDAPNVSTQSTAGSLPKASAPARKSAWGDKKLTPVWYRGSNGQMRNFYWDSQNGTKFPPASWSGYTLVETTPPHRSPEAAQNPQPSTPANTVTKAVAATNTSFASHSQSLSRPSNADKRRLAQDILRSLSRKRKRSDEGDVLGSSRSVMNSRNAVETSPVRAMGVFPASGPPVAVAQQPTSNTSVQPYPSQPVQASLASPGVKWVPSSQAPAPPTIPMHSTQQVRSVSQDPISPAPSRTPQPSVAEVIDVDELPDDPSFAHPPAASALVAPNNEAEQHELKLPLPDPSSTTVSRSQVTIESNDAGLSRWRTPPRNRAFVLLEPSSGWVKKELERERAEARIAANRQRRAEERQREEQKRKDRISETSTASVMMMNECPCAWDDCDVIMNNAINLRDHLVGHVAKMEFEGEVACKWGQCTKRFDSIQSLRWHAYKHAIYPLVCPKVGCEITCIRPEELCAHVYGDHEDSTPFRGLTNVIRPPDIPAHIQDPPRLMPSYMVEAYEVRGARISKEYHAQLGPWVFRNIFGPVDVSPRRYNAAQKRSGSKRIAVHEPPPPSHPYAGIPGEYDFLARTAQAAEKIPKLDDLPSTEVSIMVSEGLVFWGREVVEDSDYSDEEHELVAGGILLDDDDQEEYEQDHLASSPQLERDYLALSPQPMDVSPAHVNRSSNVEDIEMEVVEGSVEESADIESVAASLLG